MPPLRIHRREMHASHPPHVYSLLHRQANALVRRPFLRRPGGDRQGIEAAQHHAVAERGASIEQADGGEALEQRLQNHIVMPASKGGFCLPISPWRACSADFHHRRLLEIDGEILRGYDSKILIVGQASSSPRTRRGPSPGA